MISELRINCIYYPLEYVHGSDIILTIIIDKDKLIWRTIGPKSFLFGIAHFSFGQWCS